MNEILESNNPQHEYWLTRNYWSVSIGLYTRELIIEIKNFVFRSPCWWVESMPVIWPPSPSDRLCWGKEVWAGLHFDGEIKLFRMWACEWCSHWQKRRVFRHENITVAPTCLGRPNRWNQQWHARCSRASKPRAQGKFNCINRFLVKFKRDNFIFCR